MRDPNAPSRGAPGPDVPGFVVAGAGRAGTTGLVEGLRAHPGVFVTSPKEPHYLALHGTRADFRGPGDEETINRTVVTREADYRAMFAAADAGATRGEGSVSTLYHHERALPELLRLNPEARVVVLLREPVERAWSSFQYLRGQGRESEEDFRAAFADGERRRAAGWHHLWHYQAMSRYADALAALRSGLAPGHLGVWFHDDLEADYPAVLAQVCAFLGVSVIPGLGADAARVNVSGTPRHRHVQQVVVRASQSPAMRRAVRSTTSWRFREAVRGRLLRRGDVPPEVTRDLAPLFADDLARLRTVLDGLLPPGRTAPAWASGVGALR